MCTYTLSINKQEYEVESVHHLQQLLSSVTQLKFADIWLDQDDGENFYLLPAMCALLHEEWAWLMYMRDKDGDPGFSSRSKQPVENDVDVLFQLSNGQTDEFPLSQCIPANEALKAIQHFYEHGDKPEFISWHDDGA